MRRADRSCRCSPSMSFRCRRRHSGVSSLILKMSMSLDGYVEPTQEHPEWIAAGRSRDGGEWLLDTVSTAGAHLVGAAPYTLWVDFWPRPRADRGGDERDPQGGALEFAHVRPLA